MTAPKAPPYDECVLVGTNGNFLWAWVADGSTGTPAGHVRVATSSAVTLTPEQVRHLADHLHALAGGERP